jgi:hypothetical protein
MLRSRGCKGERVGEGVWGVPSIQSVNAPGVQIPVTSEIYADEGSDNERTMNP